MRKASKEEVPNDAKQEDDEKRIWRRVEKGDLGATVVLARIPAVVYKLVLNTGRSIV